ncbi:cohesin loading factor-domain-containing protein [Dendryphion nanum]|uniref:Cohesin loading factor-domain-containing protein n=1 Tax=Dendryphion nanum TaxID=256645 RepID=A0A9P9IF42_9PLEO|nr:cohesin loading factor-domain-containing protein [Dendryphion nanum]
MDPRYQWPPQAYHNGQYPQPQLPPNGYLPNGYPPQHPQQPLPSGYPASQPIPNHPRVVIPPRPTQQPQQYHHQMGSSEFRPPPRPGQPQVIIPAKRPSQDPMGGGMANPKIRQVQVPVQKSGQVQRISNGALERDGGHGQSRGHNGTMQQPQTPMSKPVQRAYSHQENIPRSQERNQPLQPPNQNQNYNRTPLQAQSASKQRTGTSQVPGQLRSPSLSHTPSSQVRSHPQVVIKKTAPPTNVQGQRSQQHPYNALPTDLTVLLLTAADEYINAAHSIGSVASKGRETELQHYYKLMATGLGCMEAVLKKYSQQPRDEAKLRLRYASLLIEETDNDVEIEDVLTKGIALCTRCRLLDLKYSMQHVYARYQSKTNRRGALKFLEGPIAESESFQHISWVYAFRFLKVSIALQVAGRSESAAAQQQLHQIQGHANKRGDRAIFVTACAIEAMFHLRTPGIDHIEQAQRAIAAARSLQLQTSAEQLGQISALIDCVDVACSLQQGRPDFQKMAALQEKFDTYKGPQTKYFSVLIEKTIGGNLTMTTGGIFNKTKDGRDEIVFSWLRNRELNGLGYYLSGLTALAHDTRGPKYLKEGWRYTQDSLQRSSSQPTSLLAAIQQKRWIAVLDWHLRFTLGLVACRSDDLRNTHKVLTSLRQQSSQSPFDSEPYTQIIDYLSGVYDQSRGALDSALTTYSSSCFNLPDANHPTDFKTDLAILATMNRFLILQNPSHPQHFLAGMLFSQLEPLCSNHPNLFILSAFKLIRALNPISTAEPSIQRQKTLVQNAIQHTDKLKKDFKNFQLVTICLNYLAARFFADNIAEQAVKSVQAARSVSKQNQSALWRAVSLGLCITTFQRNGYLQDAAICQQDFLGLWEVLPGPLRDQIIGVQGGGGGGRVKVEERDEDVGVKIEEDEDEDADGDYDMDD